MARGSAGKAQQRWQERLARFESSGLTVEAFCLEEQVSTASFYHWRRRLANIGSSAQPTADAQPLFQAVHVSAVTAVLSIQLPNGTKLQVPADQLDLARVVVAQLAAPLPSNVLEAR